MFARQKFTTTQTTVQPWASALNAGQPQLNRGKQSYRPPLGMEGGELRIPDDNSTPQTMGQENCEPKII